MKIGVSLIAVAVAIVLYASVAASSSQPEDVQAKVKSLLDQLENGPSDAKRNAAEWELLKLGPDILPFLNPDHKADKSKERLATVHAILQDLLPRTWTAKANAMPLAKALEELKTATGLTLADRRQSNKGGSVEVDLNKGAYWEAVEQLAAQTNSRLSLYQPDGLVALVDGPASKQPVVLHGPFRVTVSSIATKIDLRDKTHMGVLGLEIAWESRFTPYLIEVGKLSFQTGPQGQKSVTKVPAGGPVVVRERNARDFEVFFLSPPRTALGIENVIGHFVVTTPSKSLAFYFKPPRQDDNQTQDGIQVTLAKIEAGKDWWTVEWAVDMPAAGPTFDSFQTWLAGKEWLDQVSCHLEQGAGENKTVLQPHPLHTDASRRLPTRAMVRFQFMPPKNGGTIADWRLACRVPGRMVEVNVPFSFPHIELP